MIVQPIFTDPFSVPYLVLGTEKKTRSLTYLGRVQSAG